ETPLDDIRAAFAQVAASDCDVILQVGTALPVVAILAELEATHGKPIVACNAAVYWQALRSIGITDPITGFGQLLEAH
ncbi:MAG: arylmalonate decarboxylase, partial [Pseudomonadota bacterium]